jgi:LysM repeat protein
MSRKIILFPLLSLLLAACGQAAPPDLWGEYSTPTPEGFIAVEAAQVAVSLSPSATSPLPTPQTTPSIVTPAATRPASPSPTPSVKTPSGTKEANILYYSQSGDYLEALAAHFGVAVEEINSPEALPATRSLLPPETLLVIPDRLLETTPHEKIFPDSEIVFSATSSGFDLAAYITEADAYLNEYEEYLGSTGWTSGAEAIARLAQENSINPRLLVALLEYESGWVHGQPSNLSETDYPLNYIDIRKRGLFRQMMRAVQDLSLGYYGWRDGSLTELTFPDGSTKRIAPDLNAGSVAIQYYFAQKLDPERWAQAIDPRVGFPAQYADMFGDPWAHAHLVEPLIPAGLTQPHLNLPFEAGTQWAYTGGPHSAWEHEGALAALDFAPNETSGCSETDRWVVASAPGLVVRSDHGVVVLDLDGDGSEETGWSLLYLHIATKGRVPLNTWVEADERIGKPSCEGGVATGTHLHFARKYNGEWILADGTIPFDLDGWVAHQGSKPYLGTLTRGEKTVTASVVGDFVSIIFRDPAEDE